MSKKKRIQKEEQNKKEAEEKKITDFKNIAEKRVAKINDGLDSLGNLSARNKYTYTSDQVDEIFEYIERECGKCKEKFTDRNDYFKFKKI